MPRLLLTGAAGYIGSHLYNRLIRDGAFEVHALVRSPIPSGRLGMAVDSARIHRADLTDADAIGQLFDVVQPDVVWHSATVGARRTQSSAHEIVTNTTSAIINVIASAQRVGALVVAAGSSAEYSPSEWSPSEASRLAPAGTYGAAKAFETLYALGTYDRACVLRLFPAYGPVDDDVRVLPSIVRSYLAGRAPILGHPDTARDFVHLDDVYDAFLKATQHDARGVFNIATGVSIRMGDADAMIRERLATTLEPLWSARSAQAPQRANVERARAELGWTPRITFSDGMASTVDWFASRTEVLVDK